jgi:serine/threonine-protein kinase RsbT
MRPVAREAVIPIKADTDIVAARQHGRELATTLGFVLIDATLLATVISELARNIVRYAVRGEICFAPVQSGERVGITVVARHKGPGTTSASLPMQNGHYTSGDLGLGLLGVKRLMDEFRLVSDTHTGTTITIKMWKR